MKTSFFCSNGTADYRRRHRKRPDTKREIVSRSRCLWWGKAAASSGCLLLVIITFVSLVSCSPLMNYSQSMDWLGILGFFVGVIGTFVGIFGAAWGIWQWLDSKQKGDVMIGFLHGLKAGELNPLQLEQVNDMLARFDPPRKAQCVPTKNTAGSS